MIPAVLTCSIQGDALGAPFEMQSFLDPKIKKWDGTFKSGNRVVNTMVEKRVVSAKQKAGQYTDDGKMSFALARSLIENNGFDAEKTAQKYLDWYNTKDYRGIGSGTAHALSRLKLGASWEDSGMVGDEFGGNGVVMRIGVLGVRYRNDIPKLVESAIQDATITHNNKEPKVGAVALSLGTAYLTNLAQQNELGSNSKKTDKHSVFDFIIKMIESLGPSKTLDNIKKAKEYVESGKTSIEDIQQIGVSPWTVHTTAMSLLCFVSTGSFKEAVEKAVRSGGDTDTNACCVGALCGAFYGFDGIEEHYKSVEDYELAVELDKQLFEASKLKN